MPKILYHIYMKGNNKKQLNTFNAQNGGMLYSFLIVCVFFTSLIFSLVSEKLGSARVVLGYCLGPISIVLALILVKTKTKNSPISPLFPVKFALKPTLATALIFIGLTFGLSNLNVYFAKWLESLGVTISEPQMPEGTPVNVILIIVTACLLPAVMEETIFRGAIVNSLKSTGAIFTALISGLVFALYHMSPTQTIYQFLCGAIYTLIIIFGGNFIHTVIIHFLNNLFVVLNHYYFGIETTPLLTVLGLLCLGVGIALLVIKNSPKKPDKTLAKEERKGFLISAFVGIAITLVFWIEGLFL